MYRARVGFGMANHQRIKNIAFLICIFAAHSLLSKAVQLPNLTIFIHGTVMPYLALTTPSWFWKGEVHHESNYAKLLTRVRKNALLFENHPMLKEGLVKIPREKIEALRKGILTPSEARCGIYYLISAYDEMALSHDLIKKNHEYAAYGWSGMNSVKAREEAGEKLYEALFSIKNYYSEIDLLAYSHGGNAALSLYKAECRQKKDIKIKRLIMHATPIQVETAAAIYSPMFEHIYLLWSNGDQIQPADGFSTSSGVSFGKMSDLVNLHRFKDKHPQCTRADTQLIVNGNEEGVDHFNMFLVGTRPIYENFGHLPVAILTPVLIKHIDQMKRHVDLQANIYCGAKTIKVSIKPFDELREWPAGKSSANLYELVHKHRVHTDKHWKPLLAKAQSALLKAYKSIVDLFSEPELERQH